VSIAQEVLSAVRSAPPIKAEIRRGQELTDGAEACEVTS